MGGKKSSVLEREIGRERECVCVSYLYSRGDGLQASDSRHQMGLVGDHRRIPQSMQNKSEDRDILCLYIFVDIEVD